MEKSILITMVIVSALFLILTIFYIYAATGKIKYLSASKFTNDSISIKIKGIPIDQPMQELVNQLNFFIEKLNTSNKRMNIASAITAGIGLLSSIVSIYLFVQK